MQQNTNPAKKAGEDQNLHTLATRRVRGEKGRFKRGPLSTTKERK